MNEMSRWSSLSVKAVTAGPLRVELPLCGDLAATVGLILCSSPMRQIYGSLCGCLLLRRIGQT